VGSLTLRQSHLLHALLIGWAGEAPLIVEDGEVPETNRAFRPKRPTELRERGANVVGRGHVGC
jgi:hypothetical protein